nr:MAG TPA: hypothetical protein [Caudoviricetes sp.]
MADEMKKKSGRPPLSPDEREARRKERNKRDNERKKAQGYIAQKRYREAQKGKRYQPKLSIPANKKDVLFNLMKQTGFTTTELFVKAVEDKYDIVLHDESEDNKI